MDRWEDTLPPIARERLSRIKDLTPEEKERLKDSRNLDSVLSRLFLGQLEPEGLWLELRKYRDHGKFEVLKEAQSKLIDSIRLKMDAAELQKRRAAIVAIETLKEQQNTAVIEMHLDALIALQETSRSKADQVYEQMRADVKRDPRSRMQQVVQGGRRMIVQLGVDEAVKNSPNWKEFLAGHEKGCAEKFAGLIHELKKDVG